LWPDAGTPTRLRAHTVRRQAIPEQAKELGISEAAVVKNIMPKDAVDGEFTTVEDVAEATLFFAAFESNAPVAGHGHGWFMQ
jgi:3-hydroxybutyrate dehydrogenase